MNNITLSKYITFNKMNFKFELTEKGKDIILKEKKIITDAKGIDDWIHHFVCEMINLCSGKSPFNYTLDSIDHEKMLSEFFYINETIISYIEPTENKQWLKKMYKIIDYIIDEIEPK